MEIFQRFKHKPPLYQLRVLIKYIKLNISSNSQYSYSIWENDFYDSKTGKLYVSKLTKLINIIKTLKQDEVNSIVNLFENTSIKSQLDEILKKISSLTPLIIENLLIEKRNDKYILDLNDRMLLKEYLKCIESLVNLEDIIFKEIDLDKYLISENYKIGSFLGSGTNSKAYEIKNHNELVLVISNTFSISKFRDEKKKQKICSNVNSSIGFAKIVQVGVLNNKIARIMQKAPGNPLHVNKYEDYNTWLTNISILANAPQQHYNKLVKDVIDLLSVKITVDVSKSDNIFYDNGEGFTIIDPVIQDNPTYHSLIGPLCNYYRYEKDLTQEGIKYIIMICNKLEIAGDLGIEDINKMKKFVLDKR